MNQPLSRRTFLKQGLAALSASALASQGCEPVYVCDGACMARPTDSQLEPATAAYFNSTAPVKAYDPELADLVNETWVKEYRAGLNEHLCIAFVNDLAGMEVGDYERDTDFSWKKLRAEKIERVLVENRLEPAFCYNIIGHELGHQFAETESLPELTGYRMGTMATIHVPSFGKASKYITFTIAHSQMNLLAQNAFIAGPDGHTLGTLAALFALNQHNGSFSEANTALAHNNSTYMNHAQAFVTDAVNRPLEPDVHEAFPDGQDIIVTPTYWRVALFDLWNKVAHQVLEHHITKNQSLDSITKTELLQGMKQAARFPVLSNPTDSGSAVRYISATFYKEGFEQPMIYTPLGYDYSIPQGL